LDWYNVDGAKTNVVYRMAMDFFAPAHRGLFLFEERKRDRGMRWYEIGEMRCDCE